MSDAVKPQALSKVPEVTLVFWVIKIAATTLGETGGDTVTMTLNWGYLAGTVLFLGLCVVTYDLGRWRPAEDSARSRQNSRGSNT